MHSITLQEAIEAFNKRNEKYFEQRSISKEGRAFIKSHDVAHVVFGCDTTIYGEGVVKIWTSFGTTLGFWKVVNGYSEADAFQLFKMYSLGHVYKHIFRLLTVIPKILFRVSKMSKPWPFDKYTPYLDTPLEDIRAEFNILVL